MLVVAWQVINIKEYCRISTLLLIKFFNQNAEMRVSLTIYSISCIKSTLTHLPLFKLYFLISNAYLFSCPFHFLVFSFKHRYYFLV